MWYTQGVTRQSWESPKVSHTPQFPRGLCSLAHSWQPSTNQLSCSVLLGNSLWCSSLENIGLKSAGYALYPSFLIEACDWWKAFQLSSPFRYGYSRCTYHYGKKWSNTKPFQRNSYFLLNHSGLRVSFKGIPLVYDTFDNKVRIWKDYTMFENSVVGSDLKNISMSNFLSNRLFRKDLNIFTRLHSPLVISKRLMHKRKPSYLLVQSHLAKFIHNIKARLISSANLHYHTI